MLPRRIPLLSLALLGGSWDLVSMVLSNLIGVTSIYKYKYPSNNRPLILQVAATAFPQLEQQGFRV